MKDKAKERARSKRWKDKNMIKVTVNLNVGTNSRDQAIAEWLKGKLSKSDTLKNVAFEAIMRERQASANKEGFDECKKHIDALCNYDD